MLFDRQPDGTIIFSGTWKDYVAERHKATPDQRVVLDDGRPAIRRVSEAGEISYVTIYEQIWPEIRRKLKDMMALTPPKKRERLCELCRNPLRVAREYGGCWTFVCDTCKSTEIHGKDRVGGVVGAGEAEKQ